MTTLVSIAGIDQAVSNLLLSPETQKAKLLAAIRGRFSSDEDLQAVTEIPGDLLVAALWDDDSTRLKDRRKSLSSLKSALNKSLKALTEQGLNPEGLILSRSNVFEVSDEQKKLLLEKAGIGGADIHLAETIAACKEAFPTIDGKIGAAGLAVFLQDLEKAKGYIDHLQETLREKEREISVLQEKVSAFSAGISPGELGADLVGIGATAVLGDGLGTGGDAEDKALAPEFEELELVEEEIAEIEIDEDAVLAEGDGTGEEGASGPGGGGGEVVADGEFDGAGDADLVGHGATAVLGDGLGIGGDAEGKALAQDFEELELVEAEIEEIEIDEDAVLAAGDGAGEEGASGLGGGGGAVVADGEFDGAGDADLVGHGATAVLGDGLGIGGDVEGKALAQDFEELELVEEEIEEIEIGDDAVLAEGDGTGEGYALGLAAGGELVGGGDFQEGDGDEFEEVEIAEGDVVCEAPNGEADGFSGQPRSKLLEILSKYLEPEDALQDSAATLIESEEGLVSQLLERFTPKFIKIPANSYPFGCDEPSAQEHPLQMVRLAQFYLGQYPVTNDLFELFVRETGYETDAEKYGYGLVYEGQWRSAKDPSTGLASFSINQATGARQVNGANWRHPSGPASLLEHRHNHPVVQVSRHDAQAFAAWAGKRLPTEVEWEAAARGTDGSRFPWGGVWNPALGNFGTTCLGGTTPVDRYFDRGRSVFGIGDLLGNVYEWTVSTRATLNNQHFVLKGGCWHSRGVISACHRKIDLETWANTIGFRLAVSG